VPGAQSVATSYTAAGNTGTTPSYDDNGNMTGTSTLTGPSTQPGEAADVAYDCSIGYAKEAFDGSR
jgi:YD repeat-containing protein